MRLITEENPLQEGEMKLIHPDGRPFAFKTAAAFNVMTMQRNGGWRYPELENDSNGTQSSGDQGDTKGTRKRRSTKGSKAARE